MQAILDASGAAIRTGGDQACSSPQEDLIRLPPVHAFDSAESFAVTAIHELAHASGAQRRLNRDLSARFGSAAYAAEEVLVEWASCMVCSTLGLAVDYANNASYIDSWLLPTMRNDKRAIFRIATEAQRVADYILKLHPDFAAIQQSETDTGHADDDACRAEAA
ncbi:MAG: zincin-like metallopeptidase domain-containing protein [Acetobacteraceae bacterium]